MKKLLSLLIVCLLLCSAAVFACADSDNTTITPSILGSLELTVDKCMATGETRALFTLLSVFEVYNANGITDDEATAFISGSSYVGKSDEGGKFVILILLDSKGNYLLITYDPVNNKMVYNYTKGSFSASVVESVLKDNCSAYHKNTVTDISNMIDKLSEILGS